MPELPLFIHIAAGVVIGGAILWGVLIGLRLQEYRLSFWVSLAMGAALIALSAMSLQDYRQERRDYAEAQGCGPTDPLCIRN